MVSQTPAKFGSKRHRGSVDLKVLVCHVISKEHKTKGSSNIVGSPSMMITIFSSLYSHSHFGSCILIVLVCQEISLYGQKPIEVWLP